ncbi:MAG: hypothetical protein PHF60_05295 [Candidatus ainarchaeum sp.]|nr:hypothetical protein [Candidatus ainarchaeum sp.]
MASGAITAARGQVAPEEEQPQPLPPITDANNTFNIAVKTTRTVKGKVVELKEATVSEQEPGSKYEKFYGETPLDLNLTKGRKHTLIIRHKGYRQETVTVSEAQSTVDIGLTNTRAKKKQMENAGTDEGEDEGDEGPEANDQPASIE